MPEEELDLVKLSTGIMAQLSSKWPGCIAKLIEDKANGSAVIQSLRHETQGGKVSRAVGASPQLESGNWYLPHPMLAPWVEEFLGECSAFPAGAHDDQVDAWSQGAERLLHVKSRLPVVPERPSYVYRGDGGIDRSWMI